MNKQHFFDELERRCDVFLNSNQAVDNTCLEERDNLIRFAKAAVKLHVITKLEVQQLIDRVDQNMFGVLE